MMRSNIRVKVGFHEVYAYSVFLPLVYFIITILTRIFRQICGIYNIRGENYSKYFPQGFIYMSTSININGGEKGC